MSTDRDPVDDLLDRALAVHGRGEPRPGLEGRVLASLRARPPLPWWSALLASKPAWAGLCVVVTLGCASLLFLLERTPAERRGMSAPPLASIPGPTTTAPDAGPTPPVTAGALFEAPPAPPLPAVSGALVAPSRSREVRRFASSPRVPLRASFPRAAPLSEQEQLLLRYVSEAPREEIERRAGFLDAPAPLPALPDPATES